MCTSPLVLLQVFFLMAPEGVHPQPSPSPAGAVPTSSDLGPGSQDRTLQSSSKGTETPWAVPGTSTVGPTVGTPSAPGNRTMDLFPGEGSRCGDGTSDLDAKFCEQSESLQSEDLGCQKRGVLTWKNLEILIPFAQLCVVPS